MDPITLAVGTALGGDRYCTWQGSPSGHPGVASRTWGRRPTTCGPSWTNCGSRSLGAAARGSRTPTGPWRGLAGEAAAAAASRPGSGRRDAARPGPGPDPRADPGRADPDREHHHDGQLSRLQHASPRSAPRPTTTGHDHHRLGALTGTLGRFPVEMHGEPATPARSPRSAPRSTSHCRCRRRRSGRGRNWLSRRAWGNLPVRPGLFVGRAQELARLDAAVAGPGGVVVQAVHGLAGIGKSTLAAHWAAAHASDYTLTWWITAATPAAIDAAWPPWLSRCSRRCRVSCRRRRCGKGRCSGWPPTRGGC